MATAHQVKPRSFLSPQYINGVYIPSGLLIVGVAICKFEWLPYAIALALTLGTFKIYQNRLFLNPHTRYRSLLLVAIGTDIVLEYRSEKSPQTGCVSRIRAQREDGPFS